MSAAEKYHEVPDGTDIFMMEVDGQVFRVATKEGPEREPPLLMFNGIGANLELAFPFLEALKGTGAIIFDIPGVGGSPTASFPYRPSTVARWSKQICEHLGHVEVDVSGVSWGGGMAQQFAKQYPMFTRKLVLAATSAGWTMVPGKLSVLSKMGDIRRYTQPGYMRRIASEIYGGDFRKDNALINSHASAMRPGSGAGYAMQLLCMTGWTSAPWLWTLKMPVLIMSGTDDPLIPVANALFLNKMIPNSRLELLDNGHLFFVTQPEASAAMVEEFLRED
ncbi:MAG: poly(3-hydroxyalkanoate) depolymerase [Ahrensia sp.]|nr:poly(3-hydroxyalkanoate) depolymerase [Ahrensia sp.]